jgi:hypothetical protein
MHTADPVVVTTCDLVGEVVAVAYGRTFDMMWRDWIELTYRDGRRRRIESCENGLMLARDPDDPHDFG